MNWSDIPRNPSPSTLRWFAIIGAIWLLVLGVWILRGHGTLAVVAIVTASVLAVVGLLNPSRVHPLYVGAMMATFPIGWVVSRLLLGFVFYCVVTPVGLFLWWRGRDILGLRIDPQATTYWSDKEEPKDLRSYFRQF